MMLFNHSSKAASILRLFTPAVVIVLAGTTAASCTDPVLDQTIEDQGNETQGIEKGEYHRAGQRCVACHLEGGKSSTVFSIAGTIFAQPARQVGVGGVEVRMTDSDGTKYTAKTNCVGNFFVKPSEWSPKFPILVDIFKGGTRRSMRSQIGRAADCAECHHLDIPVKDPLSQMPHIYLFGGDEPGSPQGAADCPVDPIRPGSP